MTETPPSVRDSQPASTSSQSGSNDDGSGRSRLLTVAVLGITALSVALSGLAYGVLPEQMRIHWTLGLGPYYGPEFAPTLAVLTVFPALIAGTALGSSWLDVWIRRGEEFAAVRPYYVAAVTGVLGSLLALQGALVAANL